MWPFGNKRARSDAAYVMDDAIHFAAASWRHFCSSSPLASNIHLRDRIAFFAQPFRDSLEKSYPALASASDEVILLIIAKGIEESGTVPRRQIEKGLGIILPP